MPPAGRVWSLLAAAGIMCVIPAIYCPQPFDPVLLPRFTAWAVLVFSGSLILAGHPGSLPISAAYPRMTPFVFCLSAWTGLTTLSLISSVNFSEAAFDLSKTYLFVIFLFLVVCAMESDPCFQPMIMKMAVVSGTCLSVVALAGAIAHPGLYRLMGNRNLFSSALFLMSPFVLAGVLNLNRRWRYAGIFSAAAMGTAVILTRTRSVWAAVLAGSLAVAVLVPVRTKKIKNALLAGMGIALLLLFISAVYGVSDRNQPPGKILSTGSLGIRFNLWKSTVKMIADHPWLGTGPAQWRINYPAYAMPGGEPQGDRSGPVVLFQRPHNDFLWVAAESGIPAGCGYIGIFICLMIRIIRTVTHSRDRETVSIALCMAWGISGYMVIAFFSFPKERICHQIFLAVMAAAVITLNHRDSPPGKPPELTDKRVFHRMVLGLSVLFTACGLVRMTGDIHAKKAIQAMQSGRWLETVAESEKAESLFYNMDGLSHPVAWYRGSALFALGRIDEAQNAFEQALKIHPWHVYALNDLGVCHVRKRDYHAAARCFRQVLEIDSGFQEAVQNLRRLPGIR